jgi:uncharacterized protein YecE (DUF72 family)
MTGRVFVGTSGFVYPHWRGVFYPRELPVREWLSFYAARLGTVELNRTFYRLPTAAAFAAWRDAVPRRFVFAVKASRFLTHMKKLKEPVEPLRRLLSRARELRGTLGPVLFQLPANFHANLDRLQDFLRALRRQRLVKGLRAVLEPRHPSWLEEPVLLRLAEAHMALCDADWPGMPEAPSGEGDFVYLRRHGSGTPYGGSYPDVMLRADARRIRAWTRQRRDVYVYFNNDQGGFAVRNALRLLELL